MWKAVIQCILSMLMDEVLFVILEHHTVVELRVTFFYLACRNIY